MSLSDKILGLGLLIASIGIFTYYSVWALVVPLYEPLAGYFPPLEYAIQIPVVLLITGISFIGLFIGAVALKKKKKKKD